MTLLALVVAAVPELQVVGVHGKRLANQSQPVHKSIVDEDFEGFIARLVVPKAFFSHFYVVGSTISTLVLAWAGCRPYPVNQLTALLFLLHCLRRLYECQRLTLYGNAQMHLAGYLVGLLHYTLAPLTLLVAMCEQKIASPHSGVLLGLRGRDLMWSGVVSLMFLGYSMLQHQTHHALYLMKMRCLKEGGSSSNSNSSVHSFPRAWMFSHCACPHYAAEIGLYLCLLLSNPRCKSMYFLALWVAANLSVVAYQQYCWYLETFPDEVLSRRWYILIPFVW
ncbi:hypothetical protein EON64_14645 [archaeon]|nr:MAG: hypothetical protein EON64_14645 [archaeon]